MNVLLLYVISINGVNISKCNIVFTNINNVCSEHEIILIHDTAMFFYLFLYD